MRISTNGRSTRYDDIGTGPPIVLVHGFAGDRTSFARLVPHLEQDFRVITYDQRDTGGSDFGGAPYTTPDLADDLVHLLDGLGLDRAHVLGTSFGGAIAQEVALSHPERVDRLVLGATTRGPAATADLPDDVRAVIAEAATGAPEPVRSLGELYFSPRTRAEHPQIINEYLRRPDTRSNDQRARRYAASGGFDSADRLHQLRCPTLLLAGADDTFVDIDEALAMFAVIPDARLVAVKGAGHLWHDEAPERYAALIRSFLYGSC
jgi:pimeloyl-ACP methyl ester carboxylesterase